MTDLIKHSIIQISQLTAFIEGGGFKRSANKPAAVKKFTTAAEKVGLSAATAMDILLVPDYETAKAQLGNLVKPGQAEGDAQPEVIPVTAAETMPAAPVAPKAKKTKTKKEFGPTKVGVAGNRAKRLFPIDGKDPFRANTQSGITWAMLKATPGLTFAEYVAKGARTNTINHAIRNQWVRVED